MKIIIVLISLFFFSITILSQGKDLVDDEKKYSFGLQVNGGVSKLLISNLYFMDLSGRFYDEKIGRYGQVMFFVSKKIKKDINIGISAGVEELSNLTYSKSSFITGIIEVRRQTVNRNYYVPLRIAVSKNINRFEIGCYIGTSFFINRVQIIDNTIRTIEQRPSFDGYKSRMFMSYTGVDAFFEILKTSKTSLSLGYSSSISVSPRFWVNSFGFRLRI